MTSLQDKPNHTEEAENSVLADRAGGDNEQKRQALEVTEGARDAYELPSFGGQMFVGKFDPSLLYPFPQQSEEDRKIGDAVIDPFIAFLEKNLDPEEVDATREIPEIVINEMKRTGIFAIKVPKEYGGLGLSQTNYCRLVMKVASYCGGTAVLISAHQSIGVPQPLKMFGTEEQKKKFFPRFRKGSISAFALTEPDVGSDPAQMSCTATLSDDGKFYTLNGDKLWCTNGTVADIMVVMAKTPSKMVKGKERKQITAFIVETNTPGIEIVHRCEFMGLGGIYNGLLRFTNVKVPAENLLGQEGRGLALALSTINVGRLTLPAACTGGAKQCLSIARRWGASRIQWGMPIGLHETGREKIAYIASTTLAMEAITWLTCAWAEEHKVDIRIEAAMAKLFCTEALWEIVDKTMQLRGGRGYEKGRSLQARGEVPYPVERVMRDCRINLILEGSSEIMKLFLAREAMDSHLKRAGDLLNPKTSLMQKGKAFFNVLGHYSAWYPKQLWGSNFSSGSFKDTGKLEKHFGFIQKQSHHLAGEIFVAMAKYQQNLERKQMLLGRLMEIGTDLFAMSATCSYALSLQGKPDVGDSSIELADHFCYLARRRIEERFAALSHNDDRSANALAKNALDKSFRWLEKGIVWMGPDE
ncbi:MAG TPA: acyl-CoA dehydrogenase family protein [Parachlamydiaceae bacterium]|nr:acyl-CoA dehydrogenase family protein [Parachlamydiaceae bacterium]